MRRLSTKSGVICRQTHSRHVRASIFIFEIYQRDTLWLCQRTRVLLLPFRHVARCSLRLLHAATTAHTHALTTTCCEIEREVYQNIMRPLLAGTRGRRTTPQGNHSAKGKRLFDFNGEMHNSAADDDERLCSPPRAVPSSNQIIARCAKRAMNTPQKCALKSKNP
jgi:hypothetical protein